MRRREAAAQALGWAYRYRRVRQDKAEQEAAQMAVAEKQAESTLNAARDDRADASEQWLRVSAVGPQLDPMLGRLWQVEINRCAAVESEALSARDKAAEDLAKAVADFQSATVIADHLLQRFEAAKTQLARKTDERRLFEITDLLAHRRPVR